MSDTRQKALGKETLELSSTHDPPHPLPPAQPGAPWCLPWSARVKALMGRVPRCYADHRTLVARQYRDLILAKLQRLGSLPADARPVLREWGRVSCDLELVGQRLDQLRATPNARRAEVKRLQSESRKLRVQLVFLERRLDQLAEANTAAHDLAAQVMAAQQQRQREQEPA